MRKFAILLIFLAVMALHAQRTPDEFQQQVLPVLTKNCVGCHNDRAEAGGFSFESLKDAAAASQKPELWEKVLDKLRAGLMPPRPASPLSTTDSAAVIGWIRRIPSIAASERDAAQSPG